MVRQNNTQDYSVGKLHPLSKRADCRSKYSKRQITCTCMENTAESYCAETNLKGYFLKWFPVHFCRLRLWAMRKNGNCARKAQVANTKFACRKSAMKKFAPQLRTCGFADYLSQTPRTAFSYIYFLSTKPFAAAILAAKQTLPYEKRKSQRYIESNHDYNHDYIEREVITLKSNHDYICLETSSERKQNPLAWFGVTIFSDNKQYESMQ